MAAQFKSNIRLREEKGFGSVSMKRLIFCGVGAVLVFMVLRLTPLASLSLPLLLLVFIVLLLLSGLRGGLPLWQRLLLGWRGQVLLAAWTYPDSLWSQVATGLNIDPAQAHLHSKHLFGHAPRQHHVPYEEWVLFADLTEAESQFGGMRLLAAGVDDDEAVA
jgi:hypothetical protein